MNKIIMKYTLPYGKNTLRLTLHPNIDIQLIEPKVHKTQVNQIEIIENALNNPINSVSLKELTKNVKKIST